MEAVKARRIGILEHSVNEPGRRLGWPVMRIDRRALIRVLSGGAGALFVPCAGRANASERRYLSARVDAGGAYRVGVFDSAGSLRLDLDLPVRGHGFALHPRRPVAVCFARRPGTFALAFDVVRGTRLAELHTPPDRHFYGHGVYAGDGSLLYASENDFSNRRGVIGVYVPDEGYRRVGELESQGIGPHEIALLPGHETLVVANGGIATHPDAPGMKLNLPSMEPALAYVDRRSGRLLERAALPRALHALGIRHIAVSRDGRVAVGMQYEGPRGDPVPLVGLHRRGGKLALFDAPEPAWRAMRQYCGSVAFDASGLIVAASAPRGNSITLWDAQSGSYLRALRVMDGSGVAPARIGGRFVATSGRGGAFFVDARGGRRPLGAACVAAGRWDNHLSAADVGGSSPDQWNRVEEAAREVGAVP